LPNPSNEIQYKKTNSIPCRWKLSTKGTRLCWKEFRNFRGKWRTGGGFGSSSTGKVKRPWFKKEEREIRNSGLVGKGEQGETYSFRGTRKKRTEGTKQASGWSHGHRSKEKFPTTPEKGKRKASKGVGNMRLRFHSLFLSSGSRQP